MTNFYEKLDSITKANSPFNCDNSTIERVSNSALLSIEDVGNVVLMYVGVLCWAMVFVLIISKLYKPSKL